jgi:hypothetical protein
VVAVGSGVLFVPGSAVASTTTVHSNKTPNPPIRTVPSTEPAALTVLSQSSWVAANQPFDLQLRATDSALPAPQLGLSVAVYPCLSSVSAFDQSLSSSGPSGTPISSTPSPLAVTGLPALANGGFDLSMRVVVGSSGGTAPANGFTIDLASTVDQCGLYPAGVYPVRVTLVNTADKQVVAALTTQLVYTDAAPGTQKLRFGVVLPVQITPTPATAPTQSQLLARPAAALDPPSPAQVTAWTDMVTTLAHSAVPVTIEASPQTVTALDGSGHQSSVGQLAALAASPSVHQFASTPFVPVSATGLVDAGLGGELATQVSRGAQVLAAVTHAPASAPYGAWITNDSLDTSALTQLASDGYSQVILPASAVSSSPQNGSTAVPFTVATSRGSSMEALASNADLASRFTGSPGDPELAAHQLIAELAQIYYEKPNDTTPRGVVVVAPNDWTASPAFVSTLLGALAGNPIIEPVTTNGLFATFPTPTACRSGCRLLPSGGGTGVPVSSIRNQRRRVGGFTAAAPTARDVSAALGDLVLVGESEQLHPSEQSRVLRNAGNALDAQLAQFAVGDQPITLTSLRASVPIISIESSASYPVTAAVTLTSDQLLFGKHLTSQWTQLIPLHGHTTVYYVTVQTRGTGVSKVEVTLRSPTGGLELSSGEVEVRSTATSVVGIVLSLGAVVVLAVWWIRTSRKRRALRRAEETEEVGASVGTA